MKKYFLLVFLFSLVISMICVRSYAQKIRVIVIGAHPDDCDYGVGGTAALFVTMGYEVKFVAVTNGDAGHQSQGGGALARRRTLEAKEAGKRLGVVYDVLNNHDGELFPSLGVRLQIIREIRDWNADIVITHRPNDYHPDHRYTGILVQDAAYMVAVPNVAPDVPALKKNPLFLYMQDDFQRPNPFRPDIAVDISEVYGKKIHALDAHQSQVYEWTPWIDGYADKVPARVDDREKWLAKMWAVKITPAVRTTLVKFYGREKAAKAMQAEAFEICEYGLQPGEEEIKKFFPMLEARQDKTAFEKPRVENVWKIRKTKDFDITGDTSTTNWGNTQWLKLSNYQGAGTGHRTSVKMQYSDSGIYFLYYCEDNKITATMKEDFLDLWNEDVVEVFLWTDESVPMYFEYELSPLNFELPLLVPNIKGNFWGWQPLHYQGNRRTKHATHVNRNGDGITSWSAEFYIPYSLLKPLTNVPPKNGTRWRANFYRIDYDKNEEEWQWQKVMGDSFHDPERFGTIVFD